MVVDGFSVAYTSTDVNLFVGDADVAAKTAPKQHAAACCGSLLAAPLSDTEAVDLARQFAALADPIRLRLFSLIANAGEVCSCDLEGPLAKSQPTISHHTKALADAGLITGDKRGRWMWWTINVDRVAALRDALA